MNRSMSGLPVHHQLPEFTQTHVHQVGDAIQPSCLLKLVKNGQLSVMYILPQKKNYNHYDERSLRPVK